MAEDAKDRLLGCLGAAHRMSLVTALAGGLIGGWAVSVNGPFMAQGLAMYGGNTEPGLPRLDYPWALYALCLVGVALGTLLSRRSPKQPWVGMLIAEGAAYSTALIPLLHLYRLVEKT